MYCVCFQAGNGVVGESNNVWDGSSHMEEQAQNLDYLNLEQKFSCLHLDGASPATSGANGGVRPKTSSFLPRYNRYSVHNYTY